MFFSFLNKLMIKWNKMKAVCLKLMKKVKHCYSWWNLRIIGHMFVKLDQVEEGRPIPFWRSPHPPGFLLSCFQTALRPVAWRPLVCSLLTNAALLMLLLLLCFALTNVARQLLSLVYLSTHSLFSLFLYIWGGFITPFTRSGSQSPVRL